jgi:hypothetical protein
LPASLANILVTGVVVLAFDNAGSDVGAALKLAEDVSQAVVAALMTYVIFRLVRGLIAPVTHERTLLGSSAAVAAKRGGTKATPMQA